MISVVAETSGASIDEVKFQLLFFIVTKFSKEWKIWPKTLCLVFVLFVGNFSNCSGPCMNLYEQLLQANTCHPLQINIVIFCPPAP